MRKILCAVLCFFCLTAQSWGHNLLAASSFEDDFIVGETFFSTGEPAQGADVLVESDGKVIAKGQSHKDGSFRVAVPPDVTSVRVTVDAGMGHVSREELEREIFVDPSASAPRNDASISVPSAVSASGASASSLFSSVSEDDLRKILAMEITPLKKMIMELHKTASKPDFPKIAGGVGYIIGIVGAYLWGRSRRG